MPSVIVLSVVMLNVLAPGYPDCDKITTRAQKIAMQQRTLKNANNCLNTNIYLGKSGGQSSNLNLNVIHFFNT